jgi:hypothetical protein
VRLLAPRALASTRRLQLTLVATAQVRAEAAAAVGWSVAAQAVGEGPAAVAGAGALAPLLTLAGTLMSDAQPAARAAAQELLSTLRTAFDQVGVVCHLNQPFAHQR